MIEELLAALEESGVEAGPEELADILWLAASIGSDEGNAETADKQQPHLGDHGGTPPNGPGASEVHPQEGEEYYSAKPAKSGSTYEPDSRQGESVLVRRAPALDNPLGVMRALRPLRRRTVPGVHSAELDEELSVTNSVEQRMVVPILKPQRGRWLDLALVIDTHHSMLLWHDLVSELCRTIAQTGIFRDVRVWFLTGTERDATPTVAHTSSGEPRRPQEVADPSGHRLVLVVTDTVAEGWNGPRLRSVLRHWATHNPLALLNVLPRRLWNRGAITPSGVVVRAPRLAAPNVSWRMAATGQRKGRTRTRSGPRSRARLAGSIAIPVLEASQAGLGLLAALVAGEGRWSRASCLTIPRTGNESEMSPPPASVSGPSPDAVEAMRRFQESASPDAQELAGYLSAVPLTLPVMTLVRRAMLPHADHGHLAEVALGGLLENWQEIPADSDMGRFEFSFLPGVREALLGSQLRHEVTAVQELVRSEVAEYFERLTAGSGGDFPATRTTSGRVGERSIDQGAIPFAKSAAPRAMPVAETRPEQLGVHPAAHAGDSQEQPPAYVEREFDAELRERIHRAGSGDDVAIVLVGEAGSGKTRSALEAVRTLPDGWVVWAPVTAEELRSGMARISPRTVVWLDNLERFGDAPAQCYLMQPPPLMVATARSEHWELRIPESVKRVATIFHVPGNLATTVRRTVGAGFQPPLTVRPQLGAELTSFAISGSTVAMASVPTSDGRTHLATYSRPEGKVRTWDPDTGLMVGKPFTFRESGIVSIAAVRMRGGSPLLATINERYEVRLWDAANGRYQGVRYPAPRKDVLAMAEFQNGDDPPLLVASGYRGMFQTWDARNGGSSRISYSTVAFPGRGLTSLVDSAGRRRLATADYSGVVQLWDLEAQDPTSRDLITIRPHKVLAMAAIDRPGNHSLLATVGYDDVIRVWDPFGSPLDWGSSLDKKFHSHDKHFQGMSPREFEGLVLRLLDAMGKEQSAARLGDAGVDASLFDRATGEEILVQVKHVRRVVSAVALERLVQPIADRAPCKGVVITNGNFSASSIEFAQRLGSVELIDGSALRGLLREHLGIDFLSDVLPG
ncbi:SAV_2336 N-terminal domain-related protein [Streptomyces nigrescens]|uniref:SAV_2336 N-terminal domain-related protein n=1 Tax=Streptomyces nigrescens TaxID=1920 RepID=UPI0036F9D607